MKKCGLCFVKKISLSQGFVVRVGNPGQKSIYLWGILGVKNKIKRSDMDPDRLSPDPDNWVNPDPGRIKIIFHFNMKLNFF